MRLAVLSVGRPAAELPALASALGLAGGSQATDAAGVDAVLNELADRRLVIAAADLAALNLVLARLSRRGLLAEQETAVLLDQPGDYLTGLGLPSGLAAQLALAQTGSCRLAGVIKDDSGGVLVDSAVLRAFPDRATFSSSPDEKVARSGGKPGWWVRAVVDDQRLCDGAVRSITVRRTGPSELVATAQLGRLRRRSCRGRSLQLACDPAQIVADGTARSQPRRKRTFWSEPELWRLALPGGPGASE